MINMKRIMNFYMDDSGTRHPDHKAHRTAHGNDWFSLGGIIIRAEHEAKARDLHRAFCDKWNIDYPLHSVDIRARSKRFFWLRDLDKRALGEFLESLSELAISMPVIGVACVIDRPGYNARYREKYGRQRWSLCKTAFCVAVERATKYALTHGYKLRVLPEKCNKKDDEKLRGYYTELRKQGQPFSAESSAKYGPLESGDFHDSLYEFRVKDKKSPMAQIADLYLWPMCMGGYDPCNKPYQLLLQKGKLIDGILERKKRAVWGIKYSCFDSTSSLGVMGWTLRSFCWFFRRLTSTGPLKRV
jgi:Protein of unknown function (DUF3800)